LTEASIRGFCPRERRRCIVIARAKKYPGERLRGAMERGGVQGEPHVHVRDEVEAVEY
jgi:hypothetical protein